ncbi:hypothetical protein BDP27DRAFT_1328002, partial [Rhodocollybia butyracea]
MLIVHADSRCDVCLDPYEWQADTNVKAPYAIPCGHIFCKQCLESIQSEHCPLCRKRYAREGIKKLHMDPPPTDDEGTMIQKLILAWDDEVEAVSVLESIERAASENPHLVQLQKIRADFQKLRTRKNDDKFRIRRLEASLGHLQRSNLFDRDVGLAMEASFTSTIEELENTLSQSQSEVQSLRNQLARLEFNNPRREKGKGKARAQSYTPENDALRHNPLPAPPVIIPMERYATLAGDVRSSSTEAEKVSAAIEASMRGRDGYTSDAGPSTAGPSRSQANGHYHNWPVATAFASTAQASSAPQGSEILGYSQHYVEPPTGTVQSRPRRSSRPETLPVVLDAAVSQAHQYSARSSPSRRNRIVPGATDEDRIYAPGSQMTYVNGYASAPGPSSAPVDSYHRKKHRHKSKSRPHRRDRDERGEGQEREAIAGVTGLGLIDESFEERRNNPNTAFVSGYMEGLSNGFEYGQSRATNVHNPAPTPAPVPAPMPAPVPAPAAPRGVRFTAPESTGPSTSALPPSNGTQSRPSASRRSTTQNIPPEGLADRLRGLMEDPDRQQPAVENRVSTVSSEAPSWGTVTSSSSRRQSNASDVLANLRSFPLHGQQPYRASTSSEIAVGDPSAFLPAVPAHRTPAEDLAPRTNESFASAVNNVSSAPLASRPPTSGAIYSSETPTASSRPTRYNDHLVNQSAGTPSSARPANSRFTSHVSNTAGNSDSHHSRHAHDNRPQPMHMPSMPYPSGPANNDPSLYPNNSYNPLPTLPNFGYSSSRGSAPHRPILPEVNSAPAVPNANQSRASNRNHATPVVRDNNSNALGLDMGSDEEDYGYEPIPAFAAPTPRAAHTLFLRSFSYESNEVDGNLY